MSPATRLQSEKSIRFLFLAWNLLYITSYCHAFSIPLQKIRAGQLTTLKLSTPDIAAEVSQDDIDRVNDWVSAALGDNDDTEKDEVLPNDGSSSLSKLDRYASARSLANGLITRDDKNNSNDDDYDNEGGSGKHQSHELVYGELSIPVLATILDAVGVTKGDVFLDIGSGDGALVLGASLLYPNYIQESIGVELVPGLVDRSNMHLQRLFERLDHHHHSNDAGLFKNQLDCVEFLTGNVYEAEKDSHLSSILSKTTLAVCFATTWSHMNYKEAEGDDNQHQSKRTSLDGRKLPKLSKSLTKLPKGSRIVIVDGKLDERDGYRWEGDLRVFCPDTAPYSTASLYSRL